MDPIRHVLKQYEEGDDESPGRRQVNAVLGLKTYAKLRALCLFYGVSNRRLASDLLAVAVAQAFDSVMDEHPNSRSLEMTYDDVLQKLEGEEN